MPKVPIPVPPEKFITNFWTKVKRYQMNIKYGRPAISGVLQAEIVVFGGFAKMLTDTQTDGRTDLLIEMRGRTLKGNYDHKLQKSMCRDCTN